MKPLLVFVLLLGLAWLPACDADEQPGRPADTPGTDAFLGRLEKALTREGEVFHASVQATASVPGKPDQPIYAYELWLDGAGGRARYELSLPGMEGDGPIRSVWLAVGDLVYASDGSDRATRRLEQLSCAGRRLAPGMVWLICGPGQPEDVTASVVGGSDFHGKRADALSLTTVLRPEPQAPQRTPQPGEPDAKKPVEYTFHFFVDPYTSLPMGSESDIRQDGKSFGTMRVQLSGEFVPASSLASTFFDPESIGYVSAEDRQPPPFNRWVDPQSGKFVVPEFDDREIGVEMKEKYPLVDPRWRPFSACMNSAGFVVGAPDAFQKADLTKLLAGANSASSPLANLKLNAGDALPGLAGAFLKCADQWLAIPVSEFPKYGFVTVFPDIPGLK